MIQSFVNGEFDECHATVCCSNTLVQGDYEYEMSGGGGEEVEVGISFTFKHDGEQPDVVFFPTDPEWENIMKTKHDT